MMSGAEKVEVVIKETGLICTERSLTKGLGSPQSPQSVGATPFLYMYTLQNRTLYRSNHRQYLSSGSFQHNLRRRLSSFILLSIECDPREQNPRFLSKTLSVIHPLAYSSVSLDLIQARPPLFNKT